MPYIIKNTPPKQMTAIGPTGGIPVYAILGGYDVSWGNQKNATQLARKSDAEYIIRGLSTPDGGEYKVEHLMEPVAASNSAETEVVGHSANA